MGKQQIVHVKDAAYVVDPHADSKKHWVVAHDAVGPAHLGWTKGQVVAPEALHQEGRPETHLTAQQFKRLRDLGAIREATPDEVKAMRAARKKAEDEGQPLDAFFIGTDPVGGVEPGGLRDDPENQSDAIEAAAQ
jgi:microcompartment protein CcmK/EutM